MLRARLLRLAGTLALAGAAGCSLGNVAQDDCSSDDECAGLFGLGSSCQEGYCSEPFLCLTGHECRAQFGGGACVADDAGVKICKDEIPADPGCQATLPALLTEPPDLTRGIVGEQGRLLIGGIFSLEDIADPELTKAARLAVSEINRNGAMVDGRELGLVICSSGGPGNTAEGEDRKPFTEHAIDYLAGTLGVPLIIGPVTSTDSFAAVNHLVASAYPTVLISPSATSPQLTLFPDRLAAEQPHGLFWRTCPSDEFQGRVLADEIEAETNPALLSAAVVYIQDPYGEGLAKVFDEAFTAGPSELFPFTTPDELPDLAAQVAAANPDAVVVIATKASDTVTFLTAAAGTPLAAKRFFFTDGSKDKTTLLDPALPQGVKDIILAAKGSAAAGGLPDDPNFKVFNTNLKTDFGIDATSFGFLGHTYDATYVGALGLVHASAGGPTAYDGLAVSDGLAKLSGGAAVDLVPTEWSNGKASLQTGDGVDVTGTSGPLDFDAVTGEAPGPIEIWSVDDAFTTFEIVKTVTP